MATYAIGDIQGCFDELLKLLDLINYDPVVDELLFTGDLVNRGSQSLEVLRFVKHTPKVKCVLGNHDLSLLSLAYTDKPLHAHTLHAILNAPDREDLLTWLRGLPLFYVDTHTGICLAHAGIPPDWTVAETSLYAQEVATLLQGPDYIELLENMFGNFPRTWTNDLTGWDRCRYIINGLTRMRFCTRQGELDFDYKGVLEQAPPSLIPWYEVPGRKAQGSKIIFGHWAALNGEVSDPNIYALDTGCVWGGSLTALRLEDGELFTVACRPLSSYG